MPQPQKIDIARVLDDQKLGGFLVTVIVLTIIILGFDGFDASAIGYAAPNIARSWNIAPSSFGPVFAVGPIGLVIGAIGFGFVGDLIGRKPAIILSTLTFALPDLLTAFATDVSQLMILRLLSGIGIGGLFPLGIVLCLEYVPRGWRSSVAVIANAGYVVGSSLGGLVAATLIPSFGWPIIYFIGSLGSIIVCLVLAVMLPESVRWLAVTKRRPAEIARILRSLKPGVAVAHDTEFSVSDDEKLIGKGRPSIFTLTQLFKGRLAWITSLLWLCYVASSTTVFFISSWGPTVVEALGVSPATAAMATSLFSVGGLVATLCLMRFIDKYGAVVITIMPLIASPIIIILLGRVSMSGNMYVATMFAVGFFVIGAHGSLHSIAGVYYPSAYRANGTGWALAVSRLGSIGGPLIGGFMLAAHWPLSRVFLFVGMPPIVLAVSVFCLGLIHRQIKAEEAALYAPAAEPRTA
jgi:AAHS family 4-hydroxybenzoate transporter-like MFS transporter